MRISRSVLLLLLVALATPSPVGAETTIYFAGFAVEVPPGAVLFVSGLALVGVGHWVRKWLARRPPE